LKKEASAARPSVCTFPSRRSLARYNYWNTIWEDEFLSALPPGFVRRAEDTLWRGKPEACWPITTLGGTDTSDRIPQIALAAWRQGNFVEVVDQFDDQFTFTDHALGLEFKDKGRLTEFLAKIGNLFPDSERKANTTSATQSALLVSGRLRPRGLNLFWAGAYEKYQFALVSRF
jgi:hypothetical protein